MESNAGDSAAAVSALNPRWAVVAVLVLWAGYTALQTLFVVGSLSEAWSSALGLLPGIAAVAVLTVASLGRDRLFLRPRPLSWQGFAVLVSILVFGLAVVLPFGTWQGWNWMAAFVYAPASGLSQELFFRAALLPAALVVFPNRPRLALVLHSAFFSIWHMGVFFTDAPIWAGFAVMLVPFISGIGWGWQVRRDGTVLWAMLQHSLIWMIAGQFPMPA